MLALAVAAAVAASSPAESNLAWAAHAIDAGRLDQARMLIARALEAGASGDHVERLLADVDFASGKDQAALARYETLLLRRPNDSDLLEPAGIAAARLGRDAQATYLLDRAVNLPGATWRAWNARGVLADRAGDWSAADRAYARAEQLAPRQAEVQNNIGWSLMIRGQWADAIAPLERAAKLDPKSERIAANLDLARTAIAQDLPRRRSGESDEEFAARLNDAGMIARAQGDMKRAVAAFARAVRARSVWYERAANNLALAEGKK